MCQLQLWLANGKKMVIDVPSRTVAHEIRRSFHPKFIVDWAIRPISV